MLVCWKNIKIVTSMGKGKGKESNPTTASAETLFENEILVPRSSSFFFFFLKGT